MNMSMQDVLRSINNRRMALLIAIILCSIVLMSGCSDGADGVDGSDGVDGAQGEPGPSGLGFLLETTNTETDACWGLTEQRVYGYDTMDDGAIDDIVLEESRCDRERPDEQLYSRNVLYYEDGNFRDFQNTLQQLAAQGVFRLFATNDLTEFEAMLENEWVDVVFFMRQNSEIPADTANLLADWVSDERRLIYTTWENVDSIVPAAMEAEFTANINLTEASIHSVYLGWQLDSPVQISNPNAYNTYSRGLNPIGQGRSVCAWGNDESCAVVGNEGRTLMVGFLYHSLDEENQRQFALNALAYVLAYDLNDIEQ